MELHWADGSTERLSAILTELVRRQVSVIVATGGVATGLAAKAATSTIPIVFTSGADPVRVGLVSNFNRPGGNVTGIDFFATDLDAKRVEVLRELVPSSKSIAYLVNPKNPTAGASAASVRMAAQALGLQVQISEAASEAGIGEAFEAIGQRSADAVIVHNDPLFVNRRAQIVSLAARHRLPAIYSVREFTNEGGLASYGTSQPDAYHQAGVYAGRILKGEKPGDMPVLRSTKFDFAINLKTANALGLAVAPTLLARADEVIE